MRRLFINLILLWASYASLLSLFLTLESPAAIRSDWQWALLGAFFLSALIFSYLEYKDYVQTSPKKFYNQAGINAYMCRWVSSGGRVVIFSRDMSWAHDSKVKDLLMAKAGRGDLTICLEKQIELTAHLQRAGAKIVEYKDLGHVPRSRFTIVNFEREGAQVAVGVTENGQHVIQEFRSGSHPFFAVAEDLVKFLIASQKG